MTVCIDNDQHPLIIDSGAHCSIVAREYLDNHFPKRFKTASGKMTSIGTIIKEIIIPHRKGTNKEKKSSLDIYHISNQDPLEELLNQFKEGQFSANLTSKQKLSLLKILRKNRPVFAIFEAPLDKIKGHDIEPYLDVERPYSPMLRRPPYPKSLETRKEIERSLCQFLEIEFTLHRGQYKILLQPCSCHIIVTGLSG
ncbi:hypothetical protein O181_054807 [Austropuccinia psidii MF-1]|uniref:Uncharacterized protein n=1 Tax=Austropuccinia psidii MF-1 TaxID=1389203 RepID=A0A9Q3E7L9_9BASI|nr:hypothetical protein [Austropuccinia psidii MF-1]